MLLMSQPRSTSFISSQIIYNARCKPLETTDEQKMTELQGELQPCTCNQKMARDSGIQCAGTRSKSEVLMAFCLSYKTLEPCKVHTSNRMQFISAMYYSCTEGISGAQVIATKCHDVGSQAQGGYYAKQLALAQQGPIKVIGQERSVNSNHCQP